MATYSDIFIDQGTSYASTIDVFDPNGLPLNLTNYSARGQIRKTYASANAINFTTNMNQAALGKVTILLTATQTRAMKPGRYVYNIEVYNDGGHVVRISEGQIEINPTTIRL
jgi:hypothetical protein